MFAEDGQHALVAVNLLAICRLGCLCFLFVCSAERRRMVQRFPRIGAIEPGGEAGLRTGEWGEVASAVRLARAKKHF